MKLTNSQKDTIISIVNIFETGKPEGDYGKVTVMHDGPGGINQITYGRSQSTEYGGSLKKVIESYIRLKGAYSKQLSNYVNPVGKTPLFDNEEFKGLLKLASKDSLMHQAQDYVFEEMYFKPALHWADDNGFTMPLSMLVIYDSFIHSGKVPGFLRDKFNEKVPKYGGDEKAWVDIYVYTRHKWLANHDMSLLRKTVYRMECMESLIEHGNWDLNQRPIQINKYIMR